MERFGRYEVPLLERGAELGRYHNWPGDPALVISGPNVRLRVHGAITAERDGFLIEHDHFSPERWSRLDGHLIKRVGGGDYVPYEVCSRAEIASGATVAGTAAAFLPGSNSVALAGSGASTLGSGGFWYVQRSLRIVLYGVMTTAGASPGTWTQDWKIDTAAGGTTGNSLGISAASATLAVSITAGAWYFQGHVTCRSIGTSGTVWGQGMAIPSASLMSATQVPLLMPATAPATATVDTTQNSFIKFDSTLGSASDNMNITLGFWETLN